MRLSSTKVRAKEARENQPEKAAKLPENLQEFLQQLEMPDPFGRPGVRFLGKRGDCQSLCFYATGKEQSFLNAGYAAGQTAAYLRFLGSEVHIRSEKRRLRSGMGRNTDIAILTYLMPKWKAEDVRANENGKNDPFLFGEWGKDWNKKLLNMVNKDSDFRPAAVRLECSDDMIRVTANPSPVKREEQCEFEAGVALADVMATGERMWMDLDMQVIEHATEQGSRHCTVLVFQSQRVVRQETQQTANTVPVNQAFSIAR